MRIPSSLLLSLILPSVASQAHGALLAYDGFDSTLYKAVPATVGGFRNPDAGPSDALFFDSNTVYNDGSTEVGQNPLTHGFSGAWRYNNNISSTVYARLEPSQLSYAGLTSTTSGQLNLFRSGGTAASGKFFARTLSVGPSTTFGATLYIAGLIQRTSDTTFNLNLNFSTTGESRSISMAINADGSTTMTGYGADAVTSLSPLWSSGVPEFFVLKLENSVLDGVAGGTVGDQMSLYINPDLSNEAGNSPALVLGDADAGFFVTGNSNWTMGNLTIGSGLGVGQSVIFDEFKIATEWADLMTTIPEPSTGVLTAGLFLLTCCRRRR